jgi:aminoglycoside phosphotransferase (APT) family kinase protein
LDADELRGRLAGALTRHHGALSVEIGDLRQLTGGASRQTWSFDATIERSDGRPETLALILRADPRASPGGMSRETEFYILQSAHAAGVPVPRVHLLLDESFGMPGFIMERIEGETIARKLLRDDEFETAREAMCDQLGAVLPNIHRIPLDAPGVVDLPVPPSGVPPALHEVDKFEQVYRAIAPEPHPAFELAFRWLRQHAPANTDLALVHGDYRMGNFIVGPEGVRSILDWELAHIGDPMEDLGWICVRSWRFGNDERPAGGVGSREAFARAYESAGGRPVDPQRVRFWELFGNLRWGIICISQAKTFLDGRSNSVELGAIGRRTAETEWELLRLMEDE